jgi:hypothetical protein
MKASLFDVREQTWLLKTKLLKLMSNYEAGTIYQKTHSEQKAEIMMSMSKLTLQVNSQNDTPSFNTGLGL